MEQSGEAVKIWKALLPAVRAEIRRQTKNCVRAKKLNVTSPPNAQTGEMGVQEAFGENEISIPYQRMLYNAQTGNSVWGYWFWGDASTLIAMQTGAGQPTFGGVGWVAPMTAEDLSAMTASQLSGLYVNGVCGLLVTNNDTTVLLTLNEDGSTVFLASTQKTRNILDNPDFSNPVNQRNLTQQKNSWQYVIDRWRASIPSGNTGGVYVTPGHISISTKCGVVQPIGNKSLFVGENFTLIARTISSTGVINTYVASGTYNDDDSVISFFNNTIYIRVYSVSGDENLYAGIYNNATYSVWMYNAQLFIGSYTLETIPPFEAPDFTLETLKCQYYAQVLSTNNVNSLDLRPTMRLSNPTITQLSSGGYLYSCEL